AQETLAVLQHLRRAWETLGGSPFAESVSLSSRGISLRQQVMGAALPTVTLKLDGKAAGVAIPELLTLLVKRPTKVLDSQTPAPRQRSAHYGLRVSLAWTAKLGSARWKGMSSRPVQSSPMITSSAAIAGDSNAKTVDSHSWKSVTRSRCDATVSDTAEWKHFACTSWPQGKQQLIFNERPDGKVNRGRGPAALVAGANPGTRPGGAHWEPLTASLLCLFPSYLKIQIHSHSAWLGRGRKAQKGDIPDSGFLSPLKHDGRALETLGKFGALEGGHHFFSASWDVSVQGCFSQCPRVQPWSPIGLPMSLTCRDPNFGDRECPQEELPMGWLRTLVSLTVASKLLTPKSSALGPAFKSNQRANVNRVAGTWQDSEVVKNLSACEANGLQETKDKSYVDPDPWLNKKSRIPTGDSVTNSLEAMTTVM
ncbi:hypothetical protein EI555_001095, partial [Monodon monoceros]